jgi:hypothetical protein
VTTASAIDEPAVSVQPSLTRRIPWLPFAFIALTALISILWSAAKLLWWDEFLVLWTDTQPSWARVAHIQASWPISLDPLVYHLIANTAIRLFGPNAFAIRLPSLLGFLVMQFCLYRFVRRIASERSALFALAFPALTATLYYAVEGRPYGFLLGLCGIAMISWQTAIHRETRRAVPLIALALCLGLSINTHYYGVLLIIPFLAAELFRAFRRKHPDWPVFIAIVVASATIGFVIPFAKAAAPFRHHDYFLAQNRMTPAVIATAYAEIFLGKAHVVAHRGAIFLLITGFFLFAVIACVRQIRAQRISLPGPEFIFIVTLALLPVFGFLLAAAVTHVFEPRHMIAAIIGVSALVAISLDPLFRQQRIGRILILLVFGELGIIGLMHVRIERQQASDDRAAMILTPQQKAAILATPSGKIYIQEPPAFSKAWYYEPDPGLRSRLVFVYSREQELRWSQMDVISLTEIHLHNFTNVPVESWESISAQPGDHIFVIYPNTQWDWFNQAFTAGHASVTPIGPAFQGEVVSVRFR